MTPPSSQRSERKVTGNDGKVEEGGGVEERESCGWFQLKVHSKTLSLVYRLDTLLG